MKTLPDRRAENLPFPTGVTTYLQPMVNSGEGVLALTHFEVLRVLA